MTYAFSPPPDRPDVPVGAGVGTSASQTGRRLAWHVIVLVVTLALLVVVFAAVHANSTSTPTGATSPRISPTHQHTHNADVPILSHIPTAPDFTVPTLAGTTFHLSAQRGHVVVLYFMATGCAGCEPGSFDLAQTLASAKIRGAEALAIDVNGSDHPADLQAFVQSLGVPTSAPIQWGIDTTGAIASAYNVQTLETTVVIDPQGHVAYRSDGSIPSKQLTQIMRHLT
jgi:peroxiredoxin